MKDEAIKCCFISKRQTEGGEKAEVDIVRGWTLLVYGVLLSLYSIGPECYYGYSQSFSFGPYNHHYVILSSFFQLDFSKKPFQPTLDNFRQ